MYVSPYDNVKCIATAYLYIFYKQAKSTQTYVDYAQVIMHAYKIRKKVSGFTL